MNRKVAVILTVMVMVFAFAAPSLAKEYRFAGQSDPDSLATKFMRDISREIAKKTNNRVVLKVYPANQLGNCSVVVPELMKGTIDFSCQLLPVDFDPRLEILYINGCISSYEDAEKVFAPDSWMTKKIRSFAEDVNIKMLGGYIDGFVGIGSKRAIADVLNPEIRKGCLTRIPNMKSYEVAAKAMGFKPIAISYDDVYRAMHIGACDAEYGYTAYSACTILSDVIKYWYHTMHAVDYFAILASGKTWNKIAPADQKIIKEVCAKYTKQGLIDSAKNDSKMLELMKKRGIKVYTYNKGQLKKMHNAHVASWSQLTRLGMNQNLIAEFIEQYK